MFWRSREAGRHIARVAADLTRAREAADALGAKAIRATRAYLHAPPALPDELRARFAELGAWRYACQEAICEIWRQRGAEAVPPLARVAFGVYDWAQGHATNALCQLALDGIETEALAARIAAALPGWRYEQILRVCDRVGELAARSEPLWQAYAALVERYRASDPVDAFVLVAAASRAAPERIAAAYGDFLRQLSDGAGLEGRTAYDDGHVVETAHGLAARSGPTYPRTQDYHRIRAAVLLHELVPGDRANTDKLRAWAAEHPDARVRDQLVAILATLPPAPP